MQAIKIGNLLFEWFNEEGQMTHTLNVFMTILGNLHQLEVNFVVQI